MVRRARGVGNRLDPRYAKRRRALLLASKPDEPTAAWVARSEAERPCWKRVCGGCGYRWRLGGYEVNWSVYAIAWACRACYLDGTGTFDRGESV